jgi:hypothetical protein
MPRPRSLKKMTLPIKAVKAMEPKHRSALLLLGLFLNEANWLRKLLVKAVLGTSDTPEGQASFALTTLLATTLAGKIHEGWKLIGKGHVHDALTDINISDDLKARQADLATALLGNTFDRIRHNIAFHYPNRLLDFQKLVQHLDDSDATLYMVPEGYNGDVLFGLSTLAGIEPLLAINPAQDYRAALTAVWEEVTHVAGLYCYVVSDLMASVILQLIPDVQVEDMTIPDAPEADEGTLRFFVHPPSDLEEMRAALRKESGQKFP